MEALVHGDLSSNGRDADAKGVDEHDRAVRCADAHRALLEGEPLDDRLSLDRHQPHRCQTEILVLQSEALAPRSQATAPGRPPERLSIEQHVDRRRRLERHRHVGWKRGFAASVGRSGGRELHRPCVGLIGGGLGDDGLGLGGPGINGQGPKAGCRLGCGRPLRRGDRRVGLVSFRPGPPRRNDANEEGQRHQPRGRAAGVAPRLIVVIRGSGWSQARSDQGGHGPAFGGRRRDRCAWGWRSRRGR